MLPGTRSSHRFSLLLFPDAHSPRDQSTFQKLLHINATAQLEQQEYTGPFLPAANLRPRPSTPSPQMTPLQKELQESLEELLGSPERGSFAVPTQYGWVLGEMPSQGPNSDHSARQVSYHCPGAPASQHSHSLLQTLRCCWMLRASFCP